MALIGTIRKHGWILIVLMALALGGFILMDVMSNSQRYSAADVNTLGKVGDTEIKRSEFDTYEKLVYSEQQRKDAYQIRNQVWSYFVEKAIVEKAADAIGLGVGKDELLELQFGVNLSPLIAERFKNDVGQPDRAKLANIKNAIEQGQFTEPQARAYWSTQEKEIVKARLEEKLLNAVSKGMYTPKWQAEMVFKENNERRDFLAVRIGYDKVTEAEAPVTDSDYKEFLNENPHMYDQQEETRVISFVSFDVIPTKADSATAYDAVKKLMAGFSGAKSDSIYAISNGGSYLGQYIPKDKFPASFADSVVTRPIGSFVGPFIEAGEYTGIKIIDRKLLPDSVKARHILIREKTPASEARADSLIALIKSGKQRFDSLAIQVSQDPGSGRVGGDLGWFGNGSMVKEFNDLCFMTGEQGKIYKISTQFGWHVVEIMGKKFVKNESSVKVAVVSRRIEPSKTTQQAMKDRAVALLQKSKSLADLETIAGQQNLKVLNTTPIKINDYNLGANLGAGEDAREIVRWAFEDKTEAGSISKEVFSFGDANGGYFDSKYVVAAVKYVVPKGESTVATLKAVPEADARVKNLKRAQVIKTKTQNATDLAAFAGQWGGKVDTLRNANFLQTSNEPRVTGALFGLETGKISDLIFGTLGVVLVQPLTDKTAPQMPADMTMFRRQLSSQASNALKMSMMKSLQRQSDVKDNRFRFW